MNLSRFFFVLKEGFLQLFRTRGLSTAVVVIVAATLLQLSVFLGISRTLDRALGSAREKFQMAVFLTPASDDSDRKRIQTLLLSDSRVASVRLVTKEEAVQDFRQDPEIDRMLQALGENPLTDSFTVILRNDDSEKLEDLVAKLKQDSRIEEVDYGKNEWETVSNLTRVARWGGLILGGFIFLTALFIVSNTLTLALWARREDFILMARMGAPTWMRTGPYLWEGLFQGFLGALIVVAFFEAVRHWAGMALQKYGGFDVLVNLAVTEWESLYLTLVLLGMILGFLGAFLALQKKWVKELR
jgi:cell division transport system permease protein